MAMPAFAPADRWPEPDEPPPPPLPPPVCASDVVSLLGAVEPVDCVFGDDVMPLVRGDAGPVVVGVEEEEVDEPETVSRLEEGLEEAQGRVLGRVTPNAEHSCWT